MVGIKFSCGDVNVWVKYQNIVSVSDFLSILGENTESQ